MAGWIACGLAEEQSRIRPCSLGIGRSVLVLFANIAHVAHFHCGGVQRPILTSVSTLSADVEQARFRHVDLRRSPTKLCLLRESSCQVIS